MFAPVLFAEPVLLADVINCAFMELNPVNVYPKSTPATKAIVAIVVVENFIYTTIDNILLKHSCIEIELYIKYSSIDVIETLNILVSS